MENNYASFAKHNGNLMRISSSDEFFKNELIVKLKNDCIIFEKLNLDYRGKTYIPRIVKNRNQRIFEFKMDIPNGRYLFDRFESNEDCKIIYFN
jgi:hypothetical protein